MIRTPFNYSLLKVTLFASFSTLLITLLLLLLVAMVTDEVDEADEELSLSLVVVVLEIVDNCFREMDR
jgi:hypothetical protein